MSFLRLVVLTVAFFFLSDELVAQSAVESATNKGELRALALTLKVRDRADRQQAADAAGRMGILRRRNLPNGGVLELQRIAPGIGPVFYVTNNIDAADTISTDELWPGGSTGLGLTGNGMTVGEWDGGAIFSEHPDFDVRLNQVDGATEVSAHSTHVAGTLIGNGDYYLQSRGMAYEAQLDAYDWNSDTQEMALAAANGLLVSNHSYGVAAGWLWIADQPPDNWWWIGGSDPSDVEDPYFGFYDSESQLWDQIAFDAPYYLIVKAAGNDRSDIGPVPGEEYTVIDQDGNFLFTSTLPRQPDCWPEGYDCLPTHSVAKNILTVGAVDDVIGGYSVFSGPSSVQMADFSGWGPTDDGRIKPDVVGNGIFLFSAWPENPYWALAAGTSMAAPNVTGSLVLLQQHYENLYGPGNFMRASTLKALVIHTANEAGDSDGPDYEFGWGLMNTREAAKAITENGGNHHIIEGSLANGLADSIEINVANPDATVVATLVWTDPPGTPVPLSLDPPDLMLVNDLDLRIHKGPVTHMPWVLNPASPSAAATKGDNFRDNVEQVVVDGGGTGSYFVEVSHKGALLDGINQDYSLIISVRPPPPTGSGFYIDEDFSGGLPAGWSVETVRGIPWAIKTPIPGHSRLDNYTGGAGNFAMVDNDYSNITTTSLLTPTFDLSTAANVILRFQSYFYFDFIETINVDVTTNGGANWTNVWQFSGFSPFPTNVVLDLSGTTAGHSSVGLRFRYDSGVDIQGNLWQIDNIELEVFGGGPPPDPNLPGLALNPNPADGATGLGLATQISWQAGADSASHDVYFGTSNELNALYFRGNQAGTTYDPGPLENSTTYYWRINEVNADGTTQGTTWSFTTEAGVLETIHLAGLAGTKVAASRGRWDAEVEISVADQDDAPEAGVFVEGTWSIGNNSSDNCTTDVNGRCTVSMNGIKNNVPSVTFTVDNLVKSGMQYDPAGNVGGNDVVVGDAPVDQVPVAVNDTYQTDVDVAFNGNVLTNDDQGDGPATINGNTLPSNGILSIGSDGAFTYTPDSLYEGPDSFTYSIIDLDGDVSNVATVDITVNAVSPPPPPGSLVVTAVPYKVKGVQRVDLTWENFTGTTVQITRDGVELAQSPTTNDGAFTDNTGIKGGGQVYLYQVCEDGTGNCASATANF